WELRDAQENVFRREPGDIELGLEKRAPAFGNHGGRQGLAVARLQLANQWERLVPGVKLPHMASVGARVKNVAKMPWHQRGGGLMDKWMRGLMADFAGPLE